MHPDPHPPHACGPRPSPDRPAHLCAAFGRVNADRRDRSERLVKWICILGAALVALALIGIGIAAAKVTTAAVLQQAEIMAAM